MSNTLLPCPFCGGESEYYKRYIGYGSSGLGAHDWFSVKCEKCRTKSDEYKTEAEAIAAWNRRTQPDNEPIVRCGECIHFEPYDGEEYKGNCNELVGLDSCMYEDDYCS